MFGLGIAGTLRVAATVLFVAVVGLLVYQTSRLEAFKEELARERVVSESLRVEVESAEDRYAVLEQAFKAREEERKFLQSQFDDVRRRIRNVISATPEARDWAVKPLPADIAKCLHDPGACGSDKVP